MVSFVSFIIPSQSAALKHACSPCCIQTERSPALSRQRNRRDRHSLRQPWRQRTGWPPVIDDDEKDRAVSYGVVEVRGDRGRRMAGGLEGWRAGGQVGVMPSERRTGWLAGSGPHAGTPKSTKQLYKGVGGHCRASLSRNRFGLRISQVVRHVARQARVSDDDSAVTSLSVQ